MAYIKIEQVEKKFGETTALYPSSLEVEQGEFVVFVGPSGCGKTTFLRLIAGLEEVTSGQIIVGDKDMTWIEPKDRGVAMVFQNYALYPHMTVEKNLLYPLNILHLKKEEKQKRISEVAEMLEITPLLTRKPAQLSGGQRQRVAIGRALVRRPDIFLFDEPLSNLDARLREQMRHEIIKLHKNLKRTSIYVTHDQHEAMTLSEQLVVMNKGHIIQKGQPLELYQNPDCLFVAAFLGNPPINLFAGSLETARIFKGSFGKITFKKDILIKENAVILGVRPEEFELVSETDPQKNISGVIKFIEHLGREVHLQMETGEAVFWVSVKARNFHIGENLSFFIQKQLWFSPVTEQRIRLEKD